MNLFIIGNGFDRAHELKTSYVDFRQYIEEKDPEFLAALESVYNFLPESNRKSVEECLWREFEKNLSAVNEDEIVENAIFMDMGLENGDIGIEDTLNSYWEEQYGYIKRLNEFLKTWVEKIDISVPQKTNIIKHDSKDLFLTFNYTLLLEKIYSIDKRNMVHIHGSIDEDDELPPVIGHGDSFKITEMKIRTNKAQEEFNEKECSIYNALSKYYKRTLKDVNYYIVHYINFFSRLCDIDRIYIIGHSLGDVDIPYFEKIKENTKQDVVWNIYYYDENDKTNFKEKIVSIGVEAESIQMIKTEEFFK